MSFDDEFDAMKAARAGRYDPPFIRASAFADRPTPERKWHVEEWVPGRNVTLLGGDGGTGKSLLALQLAVATATGSPWLGMQVREGPVIYISAEDEQDEAHLRLIDIVRDQAFDLSDLGGLTIRPMVGSNALLAVEGEGGILQPAPAFHELEQIATDEKPVLIVLDTLADFYPSNENDRAKVRAFIGILRRLSLTHDCAVILLAHPSLTGMSSGSGLSGSTAWNGSVRSRLYVERVVEDGYEADPDARRLSNKKSNYGRLGLEISVRWQGGAFVTQGNGGNLDRMAATAKAERVFLKLLGEFNSTGQRVNHAGGPTYAPNLFAGHPSAESVTKRAFKTAMQSLLHQGKIEISEDGPPSKRRTFLQVAK